MKELCVQITLISQTNKNKTMTATKKSQYSSKCPPDQHLFPPPLPPPFAFTPHPPLFLPGFAGANIVSRTSAWKHQCTPPCAQKAFSMKVFVQKDSFSLLLSFLINEGLDLPCDWHPPSPFDRISVPLIPRNSPPPPPPKKKKERRSVLT